MTYVDAAPNFERTGVIAGFVLSQGSGLTPGITKGVLFAQGTMYRPASAPSIPAAPASSRRWLHYNTSSGFYWHTSLTPATAGDAFVGWVRTSGSAVIAWSGQRVEVPDAETDITVVPSGSVLEKGAGEGLATAPGIITNISLDAVDYTDPVVARITGSADVPDPFNNFDGCECFVQIGEGDPVTFPGDLIPVGHQYHDPADTDGPYYFELRLPRPWSAQTWRLWFASRNATVTAVIDGSTPYEDIELTARPNAGAPGPITNISVDAVDYTDPLIARITGSADVPELFNDFDGCEAYLLIGPGFGNQPIPLGHEWHDSTDTAGPFYFEFKQQRPAANFTWRIKFVSRNPGLQASYATAPYADVAVTARPSGLPDDPADIVSLTLTPVGELDPDMDGQNPRYANQTVAGQVVQYYAVQLKITPPNDPLWLRGHIWRRTEAGGALEPIAQYPTPGGWTQGQAYNTGIIWRPRPAENETHRFIGSSVGTNGQEPPADPGVAYLDVAITGSLMAPHVTGFNVSVLSDSTGPVKLGWFRFEFTVSDLTNTNRVLIEFVECDSGYTPIAGRQWAPVAGFITRVGSMDVRQKDPWNFGHSTSYWRFRVIPFNYGEVPNYDGTPAEDTLELGPDSGVDISQVKSGTIETTQLHTTGGKLQVKGLAASAGTVTVGVDGGGLDVLDTAASRIALVDGDKFLVYNTSYTYQQTYIQDWGLNVVDRYLQNVATLANTSPGGNGLGGISLYSAGALKVTLTAANGGELTLLSGSVDAGSYEIGGVEVITNGKFIQAVIGVVPASDGTYSLGGVTLTWDRVHHQYTAIKATGGPPASPNADFAYFYYYKAVGVRQIRVYYHDGTNWQDKEVQLA